VAVVGSQRIVIAGAAATVRLGYQRAAQLGAWRIEGDRLVAEVREVDAFRITQAPLTLEITYPEGAPTRRPIGEVTIYHGQLAARLLPKR